MRSKIIPSIFFVFLGFTSLFFAYTVFSPFISQAVSAGVLLYSIGRLAGLIGLLSLFSIIISGDTARFFDRFIGMDKIIIFQRRFALATTIFILSHPLFFILSDSSFLSYLIPDFASVPLALGTLSLYLYLVIMASSILYKRISYDAWQYLHIATYMLLFFSAYHAISIGSEAGNIMIKSIFYALMACVMIGMIYRISYKIRQKSDRFIVRQIRWETADTFTLILEPNRKFMFKAGQFCFLRIDKDKLYTRHPFTISSPPQEEYLHFTMKLKGRFSRIASQLKEGEEVIVEGPFGTFTVEDDEKELVFIAGGVGITPFMSMIKDNISNNKKQKITLFYCLKNEGDTIFKNKLDNIRKSWFKKVCIISQDKKNLAGDEKGYINKEIIAKHIGKLGNSLFYICGPEGLKDAVMKALIDLGVKKKDISIEDFFW